jgi:hypothetical protein
LNTTSGQTLRKSQQHQQLKSKLSTFLSQIKRSLLLQ